MERWTDRHRRRNPPGITRNVPRGRHWEQDRTASIPESSHRPALRSLDRIRKRWTLAPSCAASSAAEPGAACRSGIDGGRASWRSGRGEHRPATLRSLVGVAPAASTFPGPGRGHLEPLAVPPRPATSGVARPSVRCLEACATVRRRVIAGGAGVREDIAHRGLRCPIAVQAGPRTCRQRAEVKAEAGRAGRAIKRRDLTWSAESDGSAVLAPPAIDETLQ